MCKGNKICGEWQFGGGVKVEVKVEVEVEVKVEVKVEVEVEVDPSATLPSAGSGHRGTRVEVEAR